LCVNDPDNGQPSGRVVGVDILLGSDILDTLELRGDPLAERNNPTCSIDPTMDRIRVGRRIYRVFGYKAWVGNWCWDEVTMHRAEICALIQQLLDRGFDIEGGPDDWAAQLRPAVRS